ncbi:hypothetical protein HJG60_010556 [Phyllostomus discolor]|uniref:Uncharacterized protein n=1 Tax=Phyllostomus discolor TaxID=89673 RepID=A0A834EF66_9CHIR|nr:hypothetical protein HJG60_010556 [Phyllostomus discolor]
MAPKHESSDAGNLDVPKRSHKVYTCIGKTVYTGFRLLWFQAWGWGLECTPVDKGDFHKLKFMMRYYFLSDGKDKVWLRTMLVREWKTQNFYTLMVESVNSLLLRWQLSHTFKMLSAKLISPGKYISGYLSCSHSCTCGK